MTVKEEIEQLKEKRNALILAHYYTIPEVQEIADHVGDSFYLSKIAAASPHQTIVFCGVHFMGESGALLCPEKEVLLPAPEADCPMAHMVTKEEVENARKQYDDLAVVCYINSTAEIKSWSDVSVTSANAVSIIKNLPNQNILFIPDKNLGRYVAEQIPEKNIILVKGCCPVHDKISAPHLQILKEEYPDAAVLVHPECNPEVCAMADYIGSTSGIIKAATERREKEFIIGTEIGVLYELQKCNPDKKFHFAVPCPICKDMKYITPEKILHVLKTGENPATVPENRAQAAGKTLHRMLELSGEQSKRELS